MASTALHHIMEWKTLTKKPLDSSILQHKQLATDKLAIAVFPNFQKLVCISLAMPVSTASVERSFLMRH